MSKLIRLRFIGNACLALSVFIASNAWGGSSKNPVTTPITSDSPTAPIETHSPLALNNLPATYANCVDQRNDTLSLTSATFATVRQCALYAPQGGTVTIIGSTSVAMTSNAAASEHEALFRVGVDSTSGLDGSDRWVNTRADTGDGSDKSMLVSATVAVTPGLHKFYLLVRRYAGTGTIVLYDSALSVVLVPAAVAATTTCGVSTSSTYSSASTSHLPVVQCSLNVSQASSALILGTASVANFNNTVAGEYEATFELSLDNAIVGMGSTDRWVNTYADAGDGVDESMAVSVLTPVAPGTHSFYLLARRAAGTGTVTLYDPALSVIVVPDAATATCGGSGNANYTSTSTTPTVVQQCIATAGSAGAALIVATASPAMITNTVASETESKWALAIDGASALAYTDRWVNVYADAGDGNDRSFADLALAPITAGPHTFALLGSRFAGTASTLAYDPSISVIVLPPSSDTQFASGFEN